MSFLNDNFIADFLKLSLNIVYEFVGAYWFAIILVAVFVRLVLIPFDLKQRKSMKQMAAIAPEVESVKKRFANNPNQMNAKIQLLYKENGISSMAGCLPMIIQLVVLLAFYGALKSIATKETMKIILEAAEGGAGSMNLTGWLWVHNIWQPDSGMAGVLPTASEFLSFLQSNANDISPQTMQILQQKGLIIFGNSVLSVNGAAYDALKNAIIEANGVSGFANGWFGLPIIAGGTMYLQQMLSSKRNKGAEAAQMQPQQNGVMKYMYPVISLLVCTTSNTIFSIYWAFSNVYSIAADLIYNYFYDRKQKKAAPVTAG